MYNKEKNCHLWISCFLLFLSLNCLNACKSRVQVVIEQQEAQQAKKNKEAEKEYQKAVKLHRAKQSKSTQKMMKKSEKAQKRAIRKTMYKSKGRSDCVK
ncbi:MAG: hypothetical protein PHQ82_06305 [Bacteroidales bacterium]|nr:hypothetical protein [Bacteroidales bacterium]